MPTLGWLQPLATGLLFVIPLMLSLSVHEYAHAQVAGWLGDATARRAGRLTLNPLAHIDPLGTVALPLIVLAVRGATALHALPLIGWARPVPVNAGNFHRSVSVRRGMIYVAAAGPLANLGLALVAALALACLDAGPAGLAPLAKFCTIMLPLNVGLCLFNLLPIGALDGGKVLAGLLPTRQAVAFERFNLRYGSWILLALVLMAPRALGVPVAWVIGWLWWLVGGGR